MIKKYKQAQRFRVTATKLGLERLRAAVLHSMGDLVQGINRKNRHFESIFKELQKVVEASTSAIDQIDDNSDLEIHFIVRQKGCEEIE